MAGKAPVFATRGVYVAVDGLTKNQLIDLVMDLCVRELGEDSSEDARVAWVQREMGPVWAARKDRPVDLLASLNQYRRSYGVAAQ